MYIIRFSDGQFFNIYVTINLDIFNNIWKSSKNLNSGAPVL